MSKCVVHGKTHGHRVVEAKVSVFVSVEWRWLSRACSMTSALGGGVCGVCFLRAAV